MPNCTTIKDRIHRRILSRCEKYNSPAANLGDWVFSKEHLKYLDADFLLILMKKDKWFYISCPEKLKTYEMSLHLVEHWGNHIRYIPKKHLTYELCLIAMKNSNGMFNEKALSYVPKKYRTEDLCSIAYSKDVTCLNFFPRRLLKPLGKVRPNL